MLRFLKILFFGADADHLKLNEWEREIQCQKMARTYSCFEIEKFRKDSLALEIVKRRLKEKPPRRRQISIAEINQIEDSINGKGRDQT